MFGRPPAGVVALGALAVPAEEVADAQEARDEARRRPFVKRLRVAQLLADG